MIYGEGRLGEVFKEAGLCGLGDVSLGKVGRLGNCRQLGRDGKMTQS